MRFADPTGYGRIVRDADGRVRGIVEERDATPAERAITEINPGFYCVRADVARGRCSAALRADNAQGEFYLTDIVGLAARGGPARDHASRSTEPDEVAGINTRAELAHMETTLRAQTGRALDGARASRSRIRRRPTSAPRSRSAPTR